MESKGRRICFFSAQYLPNVGGVERYTYNLAKKLTDMGAEVTIVAANNHGCAEYEEQDGFRVYRLPCWNLMGGRFPVFRPGRQTWELLHRAGMGGYDLVAVNTRFYIHSLIGVLFGRKYGRRAIVIEHGTSHLSMHNPILDFGGKLYEHGITFLLKRFCKEYFGVSKACCRWLGHFHIQAAGPLYNAVDPDELQSLGMEQVQRWLQEWGIPEDGPVIAFVGRLLEEKGVLVLCEAFSKILADYPKAHLVMVGDGPLFAELKARQYENVILLGQISHEQVPVLLRRAEVFCLPSFSEGMPTSVLEAIACRSFVVTTRRGGAREILTDPSYGIIMRTNTVEELVRALRKPLREEHYRKAAAQRAYLRLRKQFTWEQTADRLLKLAEREGADQDGIGKYCNVDVSSESAVSEGTVGDPGCTGL